MAAAGWIRLAVVTRRRPGRELGECIAFAQVGEHEQACCPGFSFRHEDPTEIRCRRMIPEGALSKPSNHAQL
jgi:hypothetical protein